VPDQDAVRGEICISPPLNWTEIQQTETIQRRDRIGPIFALELKIERTETNEGIFTKKTCFKFLPRLERYPARELADQLRRVVEALPGHEFEGAFICYGEEPGTIWRVIAKGRTVEEQTPQIIWPD